MGGGDIGHLKIEDEASWTITIEERKSPYFQSLGNKGKNTLLWSLITPAHRSGSGGVEYLCSVKQVRKPLFGRVGLYQILVETVTVQVSSGHTEITGAHLHPVRGAGIHIAEIAEALGLQVFKTWIVILVGTPVRNIISIRIKKDMVGPIRDSTSASHLSVSVLNLSSEMANPSSGFLATPSCRCPQLWDASSQPLSLRHWATLAACSLSAS